MSLLDSLTRNFIKFSEIFFLTFFFSFKIQRGSRFPGRSLRNGCRKIHCPLEIRQVDLVSTILRPTSPGGKKSPAEKKPFRVVEKTFVP